VFPHVTPFIPPDDNVSGRDWPYYLVASLYSVHPDPGAGGDMGWTMRQIATNESVEARFLALLTCHVDDLPALLRQAVTLAASAKRRTPVDWTLLLKHLRHWDHPDRWVQRQWARSFWGAERAPDPETT
jgi:CRISPR system Cascade subunit CasB